MATRVFIPEPGVNVQTVATDEFPGGAVIHLTHGWAELDDEMLSNPVLARLVPENAEEAKRREALYAATKTRDEAVAKAMVEYNTAATTVEEADYEQMRQQELERAKRIDDDLARGITRQEKHPDSDAETAITMTASPERHMVSATGMAGKAEVPPPSAAPKAETPPARAPEGGARRTTV